MNDVNNFNVERPSNISDLSVSQFMAKVYSWMFLGLVVTFLSGLSFFMLLISGMAPDILYGTVFFYGVIIAELVLVFFLSRSLMKISGVTAILLFLVYAALNGISITYICLANGYLPNDIGLAFVLTAFIFGVMSIYGRITKTDLTSFGNLAIMGLFGVIIASLVNMFLHSDMLSYVICFVGLGIFIGLIAYDSQKIKTIFYEEANALGEEGATKIAIIGALHLYLDVINIFLYIIRLISKRR